MADEPKNPRKEKANSLYDGERSKKMRAERDEPKETPKEEKAEGETKAEEKAEVKEDVKEAETKQPDKEAKHDAPAKPAGDAMVGSHRAERVAMMTRQEKERLDLHGSQRAEHRAMSDAHEKELMAIHREGDA